MHTNEERIMEPIGAHELARTEGGKFMGLDLIDAYQIKAGIGEDGLRAVDGDFRDSLILHR